MSSSNICVECGEPATSLYVEYSKGNIKLTRCEKCGAAVDKFIEYELVLVLLDVVLHRRPAYRHIYFNRKEFWISSSNSIRWNFFIVVCIDMMLKVLVLHKTTYLPFVTLSLPSNLALIYLALHLVIVSASEHAMFVAAFLFFFLVVPHTKSAIMTSIHGLSKTQSYRKLYTSIALPEYFKTVSILLQLFDHDPFLLTLLTLLILSMQQLSFQTISNNKIFSNHIFAGLAFATLIKLLTRRIFLNENDIFFLGVIS